MVDQMALNMIIDYHQLRDDDLVPVYSKDSNQINGTYLGGLKIFDKENQMSQQIKSSIANFRFQCYNPNKILAGGFNFWVLRASFPEGK